MRRGDADDVAALRVKIKPRSETDQEQRSDERQRPQIKCDLALIRMELEFVATPPQVPGPRVDDYPAHSLRSVSGPRAGGPGPAPAEPRGSARRPRGADGRRPRDRRQAGRGHEASGSVARRAHLEGTAGPRPTADKARLRCRGRLIAPARRPYTVAATCGATPCGADRGLSLRLRARSRELIDGVLARPGDDSVGARDDLPVVELEHRNEALAGQPLDAASPWSDVRQLRKAVDAHDLRRVPRVPQRVVRALARMCRRSPRRSSPGPRNRERAPAHVELHAERCTKRRPHAPVVGFGDPPLRASNAQETRP